ncbi:GPI inositol-deacylase PGAP1-like protein, partial [Zopfochytrium polystomum]
RYALALYREGGLDPSTPSGVPVLFIPGNAGSSHQARSLGRILATLRGSDGLSFDLFTVDTREELTAFDVDLIVDQSAYVNEAIKYILTLYAGGHRRPDSVIIVGHSMGGIVARSLLRMPNYTPGSVASIFTKATPHKAPPIAASRRMHDYYRSLNEFWAARLRVDGTSAESRSLMLVSLAGGTRDTMIDSRLTDVSEIVGGANGFSAFATGVPRVWGSADHRCVLWCKQLV